MFGSSARNQLLLEGVAAQAGTLKRASCAVCVPFPYLHQARSILSGSAVAWGAQNASQWPEGAYTGEVSASMIAEFECRYVIVGHSERRNFFHEDDQLVGAKAEAVLEQGMVPIVCVGESLDDRESGVTEAVVSRQLRTVMDKIGVDGLSKSVVAYEPVWAIGTGKTATPEQAQDVHAYLRALIAHQDVGVAKSLTILYGGSVKTANAPALFGMEDIDGGLIGGASLVVDDFMEICRAADND
jgi:triosephosphate isomerase